ncbi:glycerophosphoryl diester phosphodiesterase [Leadbetterella byssophila DSM 17132]|uniref:Glycerophosphoryl diester phosphodiesterase n=1 Tax=Leadbetterella byssophila (strain DSM 17132 / JCM 16389 / KACC 11308 / NBRC 106382 / 4M15) TaxID=649349 RepID=E4RVM9_LEAB4|nr:glycerophosphodiester phosphodiesterase family protein [Leadbetterella byssophila]ADQ17928.1 glycerophosphoryl diester phosphodiesterase [Leadbetterella byssophila DSM 17132]
MYKVLLSILFMSSVAFGQNKVVAHRGAWKNTGAPQNSLESLKHSFELGCGGTEFDINMTKDGILVVNHDADYLGKRIEDHTYEELNQTKLKNGENLPLLEDFFKMSKKFKKTILFAEIKSAPSGAAKSAESAEKVYKMAKKYKALNRTIFISFSYPAVERLLTIDKKAHVQYLSGDKDPSTLKAAGVPGLDYNLGVLQKNPDWIKQAKSLGLSTNVWTVNKEDQMKYFLDAGIDFLTTDEPELALKLIK